MSDRCEPPEELRGVDGWHWVQNADWPATVNRWVWDAHEGIGFWHPHISEHTRYLAPVTPPAEVDALRAEASEWCQKAQLFEDRIHKLGAELAAAREALRQIANHPVAGTEYIDYGPDRKQRRWATIEQEARAALGDTP